MPFFRCRIWASALTSLTLWLGTSCKPDSIPSESAANANQKATREPSKQVVCLFSDSRMPFQQAQAQFLNLLDAQDPEHFLVTEDAKGSLSQQIAQIDALLAKPPNVLLIQPVDLPQILTSLNALKQNGARIIVFDPPDSVDSAAQVDAVIACDPKLIGRAAAEVAIKALTKRASERVEPEPKGRILEIRGSDDSPWSSRVHEGFSEALGSKNAIVLVHDAPADWSTSNAKLRYAEALRLQKSIDVVFAHDDLLAQAVHSASVAAGTRENTLIIGVNGFIGPEGGLEMVRRNEIDATIQRPFLIDNAWHLKVAPKDLTGTTDVQLKPLPITPTDLDNLNSSKRNTSASP